MNFQIVPHNSYEYWQTVALRYQILRVPLRLDFTYSELAGENDSAHLTIFAENQAVLACLIMKPINSSEIKMRQVAVVENTQGQGLGSQLVSFAEKYAQENGFQFITLHARETAVPFYLKLNYEIVGEKFEEVGIPHFKMKKRISPLAPKGGI